MAQTATSIDSDDYEVLFSGTADNTTRTEGARKCSGVKINPSNGVLSVKGLGTSGSIVFIDSTGSHIGVLDYNALTDDQEWLFPNDSGTLALTSDIPTVPTNVSAFTNDAGYITGYTETDPIFSASAAAGIQSTDITKWNKIYNLYKVNSENSGSTYWWKLTVSQDGLYNYTNAPGSGGALGKICIPNGKSGGSTTYINFVSDTDRYNTNLTFNLPNKDGTIALWSDIPTKVSDLTNDAGYITGYTETDPIFAASAAYNISNSDITNWNGKQAALVSGTNIKTVNSTSLLGSGNVAVQPTLVSGTNIKTVNNNSLLGSGDLPIPAGTPATVTQISLTVANWNATTTCTKSVTGVTTSNSIIVSPAPGSIPDYVSAGVYCSAQASGTLTFECTSTPTADLVVNVMIVG